MPPQLLESIQPRPRLERRIGPDDGASWTLVVGPAGAGKTSLVRRWLHGRREPWCWIALGAAPYRRGHLADLIVRAVQCTRQVRPLDTLDLLDMDVADAFETLESLIGELLADPAEMPIVVVVDDAHLLNDDEWGLLRWFVANLPPTLHLVVMTRSDPDFPLGRERASGHMCEVRGRDLAMGLDETTRLVAQIIPEPLAGLAERIQQRTEGWAVGVRLAAIAIRDGADPEALLDRFTSTVTPMAEFLCEEVLDVQSPERRDFLRAVACLGLLDGDICDAVTVRSDSRKLLREFATDGLFLTPLEEEVDRYRIHPLLAELLEHEQQVADPELAREYHRRAAQWLLEHDRSIDAIEHLLAAGEYERAERIVDESFRPLYVGAHRRDLDRWLVAIPDAVIERLLDRAVDHCCALALTANPDGLRWWNWCNDRVSPEDAWHRSRLGCVEAVYLAVGARFDAMRTTWTAARAVRPAGRTDPLDEILSTWDIRLETHLGDPVHAIEHARTLLSSPRELLPDATALSVLAGALEVAGHHDEGLAVTERAIARWRDQGEPELPGMVDALVVAAAAARRAGDLETADELVTIAISLPPPRAVPHFLVAIALIEAARIDEARGGSAWRSDLIGLAEELRMSGTPVQVIEMVNEARRRLEATRTATPPVPAPPPSGPAPPASASSPWPVEPLTAREDAILVYLAGHLSFPEIGEELYISRHTVKSHVARIYRKLGVNSRSEAVRHARRHGLIT